MISGASKAVKYSREAEFIGNNFQQIHTERNLREKQDARYRSKHGQTRLQFDDENRIYEQKRKQLLEIFDEIDTDKNRVLSDQEVTQYLIQNGIGPEEAAQLTEEIIDNMDDNEDN
jgi:hypothetical protein